VGDADEVVNKLIAKVMSEDRGDWLRTVKATREAIRQRLDRDRTLAGREISPPMLMAALEPHVAPDAIIALDTGDHTIWFNRIFRASRQTVTFSGKWRTMGYGLPAAVSAKLQYPDKEVTALVGDGSFLMTAMELSTVVKYDARIKIVVANNGALAAEQSKMAAAGATPF